MIKLQREIKLYEESGRLTILVDTRVTKLLWDNEGRRVVGVEYENKAPDKATHQMHSPHVVLATGGFAADRSSESFLAKHRPELLNVPATAGPFSNGDGIRLAMSLNASTVDMDKIQVHPTGWVDPKDPSNPNKFLCPEVLRGEGGILINENGERYDLGFVHETAVIVYKVQDSHISLCMFLRGIT
jgi:succinate dehydrogenase/fumarate reductase flavoprotein subunit